MPYQLHLQGLRGFAAGVVAASHLAGLIYLSGVYSEIDFPAPVAATLHLLGVFAHKAVWVFFVLSGYVLTQMITSMRRGYFRYLSSRLTRLMLPTWVAVVVAAVLERLTPVSPDTSFWIGERRNLSELDNFLGEALLVRGFTNAPLWSLYWEVLYSIIAVIAVLVVTRFRFEVSAIAVLVILSGVGQFLAIDALKYLPMFFIGNLLWKLTQKLGTSGLPKRAAMYFLLLATLALGGNFLSLATGMQVGETAYALDVSLTLVWVVALFLFLEHPGTLLKKALEARPSIYLGKISFSLYVIHLPILHFAFYSSNFSLLAITAALVISIPAAHLLWFTVEEPARKLSRRIRA